MHISRRRFLDAAAGLAVAAPLAAHAAGKSGSEALHEDAVTMAQAVRSGKTTPIALVERAISRLEEANPKLNCVAFPNFERARARARDGVSGSLAGVPILIKDNVAQKGLPNTQGLRLFSNNIAQADDPYVVAIEQAGMISIGRSTLPEFAGNLTTESAFTGITRNPWNLDYTSGGSSGGSSAAVAAGVVPLGHGNDHAGSLRHAAAPCGLISLKPSRGRMTGDEASRDTRKLTVQGGISRTVRDTAAWFAATETHSPGAVYQPVGLVSQKVNRKLTIGIHAENPCDGSGPSPAVEAVFEKTASLLKKLSHDVRHVPLAFDGPKCTDAFVDSWEGGMARFLPAIEKKIGRPLAPGDVEPRLLGMAARGKSVSDARMGECQEIMKSVADLHTAQFDTIDVYVTPVFTTEPARIGDFSPSGSWDDQRARLMAYAPYCWVDNVAGTPAISLPMGISANGLPVGIQFAAHPGGERVLLELAYQLEDEIQWWKSHPPIWVG